MQGKIGRTAGERKVVDTVDGTPLLGKKRCYYGLVVARRRYAMQCNVPVHASDNRSPRSLRPLPAYYASKIKAAVKIDSGGRDSARPRGEQVAAFFVWTLQSHEVGKERWAKQCTTCRFTSARVSPNISSSSLPVKSPSGPEERTDGS